MRELRPDERLVCNWLSQYEALPKEQVIRLLHYKPRGTAEKIIRGLNKEHRLVYLSQGYYVGVDSQCKADWKTVSAMWVLLHFIEKVEPEHHRKGNYPAQIFFLKEGIGYEILVMRKGCVWMKRKVFAFLLCFVLVMAMPITARADMGPKPSVRIEFTGIQGETYYGTLLSLRDSTGPASAWKGNPEYARSHPGDEDYDIWLKFVEYQDTDGYYFLQEWWDCSETNQLNWTYHPPTPFKILLYFSETDTFYVSPVYERYAFDSYFTVDLSEYDTDPILASKSYDYTWEIISLVARIVLTIALELGIALLFGYREKKVLALLAVINIVTQITLNVALNIINYNSGALTFTFSYVLFEILVFAIEAFCYAALLKKFSSKEQKKGRAVGYAFIANAASFALGLWLAHIIPGIF